MFNIDWMSFVNDFNACDVFQKILLILAVVLIVGVLVLLVGMVLKEIILDIFKPDTEEEKKAKKERAEKLKEIKNRRTK